MLPSTRRRPAPMFDALTDCVRSELASLAGRYEPPAALFLSTDAVSPRPRQYGIGTMEVGAGDGACRCSGSRRAWRRPGRPPPRAPVRIGDDGGTAMNGT